MWAAGDSTRAIGDALGVSKNAIINMRRTLGLPGRPNPTVRPEGGVAAPRPPRPARAGKLDRIIQAPARVALDAPREPSPMPAAVPDAPRRTIKAPARPVPVAIPRVGRVEPCAWVMASGAKGRPPLYCATDSMPGLPFCEAHAKLAYRAVKRRLGEKRVDEGR
jgi:GcrA cell cycle regulator